jgi:hypothetical protein
VPELPYEQNLHLSGFVFKNRDYSRRAGMPNDFEVDFGS